MTINVLNREGDLDLASMEDHAKPACCPECQKLSPRVIILSRSVLNMSRKEKQATERNETARHEPQYSTVDSRVENTEKLKRGCGCEDHQRPSK